MYCLESCKAEGPSRDEAHPPVFTYDGAVCSPSLVCDKPWAGYALRVFFFVF